MGSAMLLQPIRESSGSGKPLHRALWSDPRVLVTSSATFAREGQSSWGRTDFPSLPSFRSAVEASNWPASTNTAAVKIVDAGQAQLSLQMQAQ